MRRFLFGLAAVALLAAGCRDQATTTRTTTTTTRDAAPRTDGDKGGVHVAAPGVNVDVDRNNPNGKKVNVEVR